MIEQLHLVIDIVLAICGSLISFYLDSRVELTKVEASALPTFLFSLILYVLTSFFKLELALSIHLATIFFGATFVGMTSNRLANFRIIFIAALFYAIIYQVTLGSFIGYGGKLGFVACIAVIIATGVNYLFAQLRSLFIK